MHKIFGIAAFAALLIVPVDARSQIAPECELVEATSPSGKRVPVAVMLPAKGLPVEKAGHPRFVVEIHVSPEEIEIGTDDETNNVRALQKCTYPDGQVVSHVNLRSRPFWAGPIKGNLLSGLTLPASAVKSKVTFRTLIGERRYHGVWKSKDGHPFVLLQEQ